eukprot:897174-Amphidinium_carterae.1
MKILLKLILTETLFAGALPEVRGGHHHPWQGISVDGSTNMEGTLPTSYAAAQLLQFLFLGATRIVSPPSKFPRNFARRKRTSLAATRSKMLFRLSFFLFHRMEGSIPGILGSRQDSLQVACMRGLQMEGSVPHPLGRISSPNTTIVL